MATDGLREELFRLTKYRFDTIALHGGQKPDPTTKALAVPIYQTSSYVFDSVQHARSLFRLEQPGNIYSRIMNPTSAVLEERIADLEGGVGALATASGQSAELISVLNITQAGQQVVSGSSLYGGTYTLFNYTLRKMGIDVQFVDATDVDAFRKAVTDQTRAFYVETLGNPKLDIPDLQALAEAAHEAGVPLIVDNTMASPALCRPIEWGADIVIHSLTKYLGGHGTTIAGIVVDSGKFDWKASGRFPCLTEPDPSYHGLVYTEAAGPAAYIFKARGQLMRDLGSCLSPLSSFLILQGVETLPLRMERHSSNALKVAKWLAADSRVSWVNYPGLPDHPSHEKAKKYFPNGFSGMMGFGVKGGFESAVRFIESCKLLSHLANIGDAKSLVIHPASTTHEQMSSEEREAAGVTDDFIRFSVGIEDVQDIIADLDQALAAAR